MFSKFKVAAPSITYPTHLPIVEVYEAEIRRLYSENEFLKLQVVHLNDSLAQLQLQQAQNAPFRATKKGFFQLSKSARNTKKWRIKKMVSQSVQGLEEFVPIEICFVMKHAFQ